MAKPKYEKGNWQITRWCCLSGNCIVCKDLPYGKQKRVVQTDNVSKPWAEWVAKNWKQYGAEAEMMKAQANG